MLQSESFISVEEIKDILQVSKAKAYRVAKELNDDLKNQGYMVIPGRVSRKYFFERFYGIDNAHGGDEDASI